MWLAVLARDVAVLDAGDVRMQQQEMREQGPKSRRVWFLIPSQDLDVNYVSEMLDKLQDCLNKCLEGLSEIQRAVVCFVQVFVKKQSYVTHEHFNSELKRLRGTMATLAASRHWFQLCLIHSFESSLTRMPQRIPLTLSCYNAASRALRWKGFAAVLPLEQL